MSKPSPVLTSVALAAVWSGLSQQMHQRLDAVLIGIDTEELHAYRVALRKTRALLKLFSHRLPAAAAGFAREFSWVSAATGPVRDLDVLLQFGARQLPGLLLAEPHELAPVLGVLRRERELAQAALCKVLRSKRYRQLAEAWDVFLHATLSEHSAASSLLTPVATLTRVIAIEQCLHLLKKAQHIDIATPAAEFHAMRIRIKRLRYLLDLLLPFMPEQRGSALLKPLARLQAILGQHQDAVATRARLEAMQQHLQQVAVADKVLQQWIEVVDAQQLQARAAFTRGLKKFANACCESI